MTGNDPPLVTVGLTTYNRADYLPRTLDQILGQSYANLEVIISDNASTDDTPAICERYAEKDDRIHLIRHEENNGPEWNHAFVLGEATGSYFMWHADDDHFEPTFIERAVQILEDQPDVALCFCDYRFIDEEGNHTGTMHLDPIYPDRDWTDAQLEFFSHPYWRSGVAIRGLYRRTVLEKTGPLRPVTRRSRLIGIEAPFLAEVAARGRIVAIPDVLFNYREHRIHDRSLARQHTREMTRWDVVHLQVKKQLGILRAALTADTSVRQRLRLSGTCLKAAARKVIDEVRGVEAKPGT